MSQTKQQRFDELRVREVQGILTDAERAELGVSAASKGVC
jgi:hypothetical protein